MLETTDEAEQALMDRSIAFLENANAPAITEELDHCHLIIQGEKLANNLSNSLGNLFSMGMSNGTPMLSTNYLGKALIRLGTTEFFGLEYRYPGHRFNPACEALLKQERAHLINNIASKHQRMEEEELSKAIDTLNDYVTSVRNVLHSDDYKKYRDKVNRSCNKNLQWFRAYIRSVVSSPGCSVLIGIRLDLSYKKNLGLDTPKFGLTYNEVQEHRKSMTKHIKKYLGKAYAGYACKLEYGLIKGYHFHWFILAKKSMVRRDILIGKALGEYWDAVVTNGRGIHFNCNVQKDSYRDRCIGELRHDDPSFWKGVQQLTAYMTKPDYHLCKITPPKCRNFWRGKTPKPRTTKTGRKRMIKKEPFSSPLGVEDQNQDHPWPNV